MDRPRIRKAHGPEFYIQREIVKFLRQRGWHVERLVGMAFQFGLPDLLAIHPKFGIRFIEVKYADEYNFTKAQKNKFPVLDHYGLGIWILTDANEEEYDKLFSLPNWQSYWKSSWGVPDIDTLLKQIEEEYNDADEKSSPT